MDVYFPLSWDSHLECSVTESMQCVACHQRKRLSKGPQHTSVWNCVAVIHSTGVVVYVVGHVGKTSKKHTYETGSEDLVKDVRGGRNE